MMVEEGARKLVPFAVKKRVWKVCTNYENWCTINVIIMKRGLWNHEIPLSR